MLETSSKMNTGKQSSNKSSTFVTIENIFGISPMRMPLLQLQNWWQLMVLLLSTGPTRHWLQGPLTPPDQTWHFLIITPSTWQATSYCSNLTFDFLPYHRNQKNSEETILLATKAAWIHQNTKVLQQHHRPDKMHGFALLKLSDLSHLQKLTITLTLRCLQRHPLITPSLSFNPQSRICRTPN